MLTRSGHSFLGLSVWRKEVDTRGLAALKTFCNYNNAIAVFAVRQALSLLAFGIDWLINAKALGDEGEIGEMFYNEKIGKQINDAMTKETKAL